MGSRRKVRRALERVADPQLQVIPRLGVSEQAVRLWCRKGVLPAYRPAGTRQWLVDSERFEAWLHSRQTGEVLDSLHAPYRDERPDEELLAESVRLRRPGGRAAEAS